MSMVMIKALKLHIVHTAADGALFVELRRHLASFVHGGQIELSHTGQLDDLRGGAESHGEDEADILVILVSRQLLEKESAELVPRARSLAEASATSGHPVAVVPVLLDATAWPHAPRQDCLPPRQSIESFPNREIGWFAVVRGLRQVIEKVSETLAERSNERLSERLSAEDERAQGRFSVSVRTAALPEPSAQTQTQPQPSTAAATGSILGPPRRKFALLVGVNRFLDGRSFPSLSYCVNDVLVLRETLASQGYLVHLLHDDMPDTAYRPLRENVRRQLTELCQQAGSEDLLLVHFACHGFVHGGQQYLAVHDTRPSRLADTAISVAALEQQLRQCPARRRILILDACQSGATLNRGVEEDFIRFAFEQAEGFVRIAASTSQQKAQEWHDKKMGAFSYFLNAALRGEAKNQYGLVTVQTVANYVLAQLRKWSQENLGRVQEPTLQYEGLGEIILADYRSQNQPSPSPSPSGTP